MTPQRTPSSQLRGISRVDSARAQGWLVRVYRRGETYSKFFSDSMHKGRAKALQRAIAHRNEYERQHPPEYPPGGPLPPFRKILQRNNKTGVNGVSETVHTTRSGARLRCFSVNYTLEGRRYNKRFYLDNYDSRAAALEEAKQFRKEMEREMWRAYRQQLREMGYKPQS